MGQHQEQRNKRKYSFHDFSDGSAARPNTFLSVKHLINSKVCNIQNPSRQSKDVAFDYKIKSYKKRESRLFGQLYEIYGQLPTFPWAAKDMNAV